MTFPIQLQLWLSPSFPVGSFAYSHGLEWAVGAGLVCDRGTALAWLEQLVEAGALRNDAILLAASWRAAHAGDHRALQDTNDLALALAGSRERHLETSAQGNAFMAAVKAAWSTDAVEQAAAPLSGDVAYPIAVGAMTAATGIALDASAKAYLAAIASSLVSALVRLSVIGQTDGQRVLAEIAGSVERCAIAAELSSLDDLGAAAFVSDIAAMAHETQESRMFRT